MKELIIMDGFTIKSPFGEQVLMIIFFKYFRLLEKESNNKINNYSYLVRHSAEVKKKITRTLGRFKDQISDR